MKAFLGRTAAVLLVVTMLFAAVPGAGLAAEGKVTLAEMVKIKKAADEAVQTAKAQAEKAKTAGEKRIAKQLVKQAETNAEVAGDLLEAVKAGEEVSREEAQACAAIAKTVNKAAGDAGKAGDALGKVAELGSSLPTAANARVEMQHSTNATISPSMSSPSSIIGPVCRYVLVPIITDVCKEYIVNRILEWITECMEEKVSKSTIITCKPTLKYREEPGCKEFEMKFEFQYRCDEVKN